MPLADKTRIVYKTKSAQRKPLEQKTSIYLYIIVVRYTRITTKPQLENPKNSGGIKMVTRYFALRTSSAGREASVFTGRQPRQAALKAASRGHTDIYLRERGTKKLHHFRGSRVRVRAPANKPRWMAAQVWKPNVRKTGIIHLARPRKAKKARRRRKKARRARKVRRTRRRKTVRRKAKKARRTKRRPKRAKRRVKARRRRR